MRISDWSSDVCSSDLFGAGVADHRRAQQHEADRRQHAPWRPPRLDDRRRIEPQQLHRKHHRDRRHQQRLRQRRQAGCGQPEEDAAGEYRGRVFAQPGEDAHHAARSPAAEAAAAGNKPGGGSVARIDDEGWFDSGRAVVRPEWIDYNGHMNVGYYAVAFDLATEAVCAHLGVGEAYRQRAGASIFVVEAHATYDREVLEAAPLAFRTRIVDHDSKRIHLLHRMFHATAGYLAATNELMRSEEHTSELQ